jgi:hypothetical protein
MAEQKSDSDKSTLIARGSLKEARKLFAHRGWDTLPQGRRGQRILAWCAIQAWLAYPSDPEAAVRRVCGGLAPYLKESGWIDLIAETKSANKRFSHDQSAMVLEISVRDCLAQGFRFLGCDDDPGYEARHKAKQARNAACQRKRRAARSTGRPCGRPRLDLSPEEMARRRSQDADRKRAERAAECSGRPRGRPKSDGAKPWETLGIKKSTYYDRLKRSRMTWTENASGEIPSPDKIRITREVTQLIRTDFQSNAEQSPVSERGAPQAPPPPHRPIVVRLEDIPDGLILDQDGIEFKPPPPHQRRPALKTWMDAALEGYTGGRS